MDVKSATTTATPSPTPGTSPASKSSVATAPEERTLLEEVQEIWDNLNNDSLKVGVEGSKQEGANAMVGLRGRLNIRGSLQCMKLMNVLVTAYANKPENEKLDAVAIARARLMFETYDFTNGVRWCDRLYPPIQAGAKEGKK